jgi:hypothetical protein
VVKAASTRDIPVTGNSPNDRQAWPVLFCVGVALYLISFTLPGVLMRGSLLLPGWACAEYAI